MVANIPERLTQSDKKVNSRDSVDGNEASGAPGKYDCRYFYISNVFKNSTINCVYQFARKKTSVSLGLFSFNT